jgi:uncharacterized protein YebE (UPF0316 family)
MPVLQDLSIWVLAPLICLLRITDVSLGTMRTISVVNGRIRLSVLLGFIEVLIWITGVSQVILHLRDHPFLVLAYAGGFATGNALGITIERKLALGQCVVRIISEHGQEVAGHIAGMAHILAAFESDLPDHRRTLVFATLSRRSLPLVLEKARQVDPDLFWVVERFSETSFLAPLPHATGWRSVFKMK